MKLSSYSLEGPSELRWGTEWDDVYVWKEDESTAHTSITPVLYFSFEWRHSLFETFSLINQQPQQLIIEKVETKSFLLTEMTRWHNM